MGETRDMDEDEFAEHMRRKRGEVGTSVSGAWDLLGRTEQVLRQNIADVWETAGRGEWPALTITVGIDAARALGVAETTLREPGRELLSLPMREQLVVPVHVRRSWTHAVRITNDLHGFCWELDTATWLSFADPELDSAGVLRRPPPAGERCDHIAHAIEQGFGGFGGDHLKLVRVLVPRAIGLPQNRAPFHVYELARDGCAPDIVTLELQPVQGRTWLGHETTEEQGSMAFEVVLGDGW